MKKNIGKRGWIRIVEASIAVLLIIGFVLIFLNSSGLKKENLTKEIYEIGDGILREVQINNTLRNEILGITNSIEYENENFPLDIKFLIDERVPLKFGYSAKICDTSNSCILTEISEKDVYTKSILITSNLTNYNPKILKLFFWEK